MSHIHIHGDFPGRNSDVGGVGAILFAVLHGSRLQTAIQLTRLAIIPHTALPETKLLL